MSASYIQKKISLKSVFEIIVPKITKINYDPSKTILIALQDPESGWH